LKISIAASAFAAAVALLAGCGSAAPPPASPSASGPAPASATASASPAAALASPPSGWAARPARRVTPGAGGSSLKAICPNVARRLEKRRPGTAIKDEVYAKYGIPAGEHDLYRIDHLVPIELGGGNSIRNLWPQPVEASRAKDKLEDTLHRLVCGGQLSLRSAQRAIEHNWVRAYHRYVTAAAHHARPAPAPAPSQSALPPAPPSPAGCYPLTNGGNCYEPGEFCRTSDHGMTGRAGDGETIVCEDNNGWRWEPA
jgi:hypothetical protein